MIDTPISKEDSQYISEAFKHANVHDELVEALDDLNTLAITMLAVTPPQNEDGTIATIMFKAQQILDKVNA